MLGGKCQLVEILQMAEDFLTTADTWQPSLPLACLCRLFGALKSWPFISATEITWVLSLVV